MKKNEKFSKLPPDKLTPKVGKAYLDKKKKKVWRIFYRYKREDNKKISFLDIDKPYDYWRRSFYSKYMGVETCKEVVDKEIKSGWLYRYHQNNILFKFVNIETKEEIIYDPGTNN